MTLRAARTRHTKQTSQLILTQTYPIRPCLEYMHFRVANQSKLLIKKKTKIRRFSHTSNVIVSYTEPCIKFLRKQATDLGLPFAVYHPSGDQTKPIAVLSWVGTEPSIPSVLLNSHMDVVPVFEENWKYPPFGAEIDAEGRIFARGSQDMKCVGVQYLAAIRALKADGILLKRTLHVVFVPGKSAKMNQLMIN